MSSSRSPTPVSQHGDNTDTEYCIVDVVPDQKEKHALEITTLKILHAAEIKELHKAYAEKMLGLTHDQKDKADNETLIYSSHFHAIDSSIEEAKHQQEMTILQKKFDQLQAELQTVKTKLNEAEAQNAKLEKTLAEVETKMSTQATNNTPRYPMFYPIDNQSLLKRPQFWQSSQNTSAVDSKITTSNNPFTLHKG